MEKLRDQKYVKQTNIAPGDVFFRAPAGIRTETSGDFLDQNCEYMRHSSVGKLVSPSGGSVAGFDVGRIASPTDLKIENSAS